MSFTIGVDIDGVLADSDTLYRNLIAKWYGVNLEIEDVKKTNYFEFVPGTTPDTEILEFFKHFTEEDLWHAITKIPGGKETIDCLKQAGHKIVIATSRPDIEPLKTETIKWLAKNGIQYDDLLFITDGRKYDMVTQKGYKLDYFIEDFLEYATAFADNGVKVLLFDYPWNRDFPGHKNIIRIKDKWREVQKIICEG